MRRTLLAVFLMLGAAATVHAQPEGRCTSDTLTIRGQAVSATYCIAVTGRAPAGQELPITVNERYRSPRGSFTQTATLAFISGEATSRVIEDLALDRLGMEGTMHLTLVLRGGLVRIESAILTPGAVTIK